MGLEKMNSKMVPREIAEEILRGSYEDLIQKVGATIEEHAAMFLPAGVRNEMVFPVATFKNNVIVGSSLGEFYRVKFETVDGKVTIKSHEKIDVEVVDETNKKDFITKSLGSVVDEFLHGDRKKALARLSEVASVIEAEKADPTERAKAFFNELKNGSWRPFVTEKRDTLAALIEYERLTVEKRFKHLYDASTDASKLPEYAKQVTGSVNAVLESVESLLKVAKASYTSYKNARPELGSETEKKVVLRFEEFAESFLSDVSRKLREGHLFIENGGVSCWALVHDGFAEVVNDVQAASGLVTYFSEQLKN